MGTRSATRQRDPRARDLAADHLPRKRLSLALLRRRHPAVPCVPLVPPRRIPAHEAGHREPMRRRRRRRGRGARRPLVPRDPQHHRPAPDPAGRRRSLLPPPRPQREPERPRADTRASGAARPRARWCHHATAHARRRRGAPSRIVSEAVMRARVSPPVTKRALDLLITVPLLVLLSPLLLAAAIAIKLTSRGPVLFRQPRIGRGEQPFTMYKFRSMVVNAHSDDRALRKAFADELAGVAQPENESFKLHDDPRITRAGKLLRATSFDEIPQLFNVVKGEMSLVGRPPALGWHHES